MAKKLTVEEQETLVRLSKVLAKISYGPVRSNAGGIASGLVRLRKDAITAGDVDSVLKKYGCSGANARGTLRKAGVLVELDDTGKLFRLNVPDLPSRSKGSQTYPGAGAVDDAAGRSKLDGGAPAGGVLEASDSAATGVATSASGFAGASGGAPAAAFGASGASGSSSASAVGSEVQLPAALAPVSRVPLLGRVALGFSSLVRRVPGPAALAKRASAAAGASEVAAGTGLAASPKSAVSVAAGPTPKAPVPVGNEPGRPSTPAPAAPTVPAQSVAASAKPAPAAPRSLADVPVEAGHTEEATELRRQILDLDPRLWLNGWLLARPAAYRLFGRELRALSEAMAGKPRLGDGTLTCRELAYQVFADEKFLEQGGDGRKLLERMGVADLIDVRPQPKLGLLHHVPRRREQMQLVVSENLDAWLDIRALMYEDDRRLILGEHVDGVIFGNGYLIDDAHRLPDFLRSLGCDNVTVLYWGDIDRAGLQIYERLCRVAGSSGCFAVRPFVPAYAAMARAAQLRFSDPLDNEQSAQEGVPFGGLDAFVAELPEDVRSYVRAVIENKRVIPQEILTKADL